eukprot:jgi/Undpi1/693/HiC_scaffold_10.g04157.m1
MLSRRTTPLIVAALVKPLCCRSFSLFTSVGLRPTAVTPTFPSSFLSSRGAGETGTSSLVDAMAKKRGPWARKKEERSRHFAKRGRVGGFGAYSQDSSATPETSDQAEGAGGATAVASPEEEEADARAGSAAAVASASEKEAASAGKTGKKPAWPQQQSRKNHEVHPGSYAGDLAEILSKDRRSVLRARLERDDKAAQQEAAAPSEKEGNGEGGVASDSSKKKVALLISYWGSNYQGLQINEGAQTVEAELELALYLAGAMSKDNFGNPRKVSWSRSGRTDKGIISLKMTYPNDGEKETVDAINGYLPEDIRAVDIKRAPKSFDARMRCSGRRYEYIMPTFVLAPKEHVSAVFEEAVEWEKAEGRGDDAKAENEAEGGVAVDSADARDRPQPADEKNAREFFDSDGNPLSEEERNAALARLQQVELCSPAVTRRAAEKLETYRVPPEAVKLLRETLKGFLGTKNYHNYTNHKQAADPSCKRLMTSISAADPFENDGMEWIRLSVEGQSFMLHQIRKMVFATVDRVRGHSSEEDFTKTFFPVKINMGIAPSEGLYLERPLYEPHNNHMKRQGADDRALEWETGPAAEALEKFKTDKIHASILAKERVDHDFVAWLDRLTRFPSSY